MIEDLLAANERYAAGFPLQGMPAKTVKGFALVTCMDTRIDPLAILGLQPGDAKIIRNAGGRVTADALRSLALACAFLGVTEVAVMHHTGCALAGMTDDEVREGLPAAASEWTWLAMPDPDGALAADVEAVRTSPVLPAGLSVHGWRYDVETGRVATPIHP
jgi:carbonic anhydrase